MTRALAALTRFEWNQALELHILSPAVLALLLGIAAGQRPAGRVWQGLAIAFGLVGVIRIAGHTL
jgi:hypothetical protein